MTPEFERAINEAVARLCNCPEPHWDRRTRGGAVLASSQYSVWVDYPSYTTDRNALPELWKAVEKANIQKPTIISALNDLCGNKYRTPASEAWWKIITAPPHLQCIAALRATNNWNDELEALWQKEQGDE